VAAPDLPGGGGDGVNRRPTLPIFGRDKRDVVPTELARYDTLSVAYSTHLSS
jgi:hypothetical protein